MSKRLLFAILMMGCDPGLDAEGQKLALAADGVSIGLEASFKAGWVIAPAAEPNDDAIDATRIIVNTLFGLCASASEPELPARGLTIYFSGRCGVPFTDLRFKGGLGFAVAPLEGGGTTVQIIFDDLQVPSAAIDGSAEFSKLPDGALAWHIDTLRAQIGSHKFALDGDGTVVYSSDRTSMRFDGYGRFGNDEITAGYVADGIERKLIAGCWPERGTLTITTSVFGVERSLVYHYTGEREVRVDDRGRTVERELPDRECHPLF